MTRHDPASKTGIGDKLRAFRIQKGLTQREFGTQIGLTDGQIGRLERGESGFSEGFFETVKRQFPEFELTIPSREGPGTPEETPNNAGAVPPVALDLLKGGEYIATRLLGWSHEEWEQGGPAYLAQQVEQYLARHPEDTITRAWLEHYSSVTEALHRRGGALEQLGDDGGAGRLSNLLARVEQLAGQAEGGQLEQLLNLGDEATSLRDSFLAARSRAVAAREEVRKRSGTSIPPDLSPRRSLELEAQRAEDLRALEALEQTVRLLAERARRTQEAIDSIRSVLHPVRT